MARSQHNRFKQAWQKCKKYQVRRLGEITGHGRNNIRLQSLELTNNMLHELIMATKGMA